MSVRKSWVYTPNGRCIEKGTPEYLEYLGGSPATGPGIYSDEGAFVSPIDGKVYSGRAGMREHNKRHDVVNNRDLAGLPYRNFGAQQERTGGVREAVIQSAKRKGYL